MRVVLAKPAYSPLLKSAGDYSCGLFDARGEMVAQGPALPIHLGSMPAAARTIVVAFAAASHRRGVVLPTGPYFAGRRLPDAKWTCPTQHETRLAGKARPRATWPG